MTSELDAEAASQLAEAVELLRAIHEVGQQESFETSDLPWERVAEFLAKVTR